MTEPAVFLGCILRKEVVGETYLPVMPAIATRAGSMPSGGKKRIKLGKGCFLHLFKLEEMKYLFVLYGYLD